MTRSPDPTDTDSRIPVTLNCSGGVSLGAFMAGVFTELVKSSIGSNGRPARLRIDSITGASAGAMTGLIAAWYLLSDKEHAEQELENDQPIAHDPKRLNRFHDAWVRRINIRNLTRCEDLLQTDRPLGLLNTGIIDRIAEDVAPVPETTSGTAPLALLMTVTNLQGFLKDPERSGQIGRSLYRSVTHAETRRFLFHDEVAGGETYPFAAIWTKARKTALASGAFPMAFPPRPDTSDAHSANLTDICCERYREDQDAIREGICTPTGPTTAKFHFLYTDGGVLDGLPILKGIGLLNRLQNETKENAKEGKGGTEQRQLEGFRQAWTRHYGDPNTAQGASQEDDRLFVYVKPAPITEIPHEARLTQRIFSMLQTAAAGLTYPKEEHDELRLNEIHRINRQVQEKETLIMRARVLADNNVREALIDDINRAIPYRMVKLERISPLEIFQQPQNPCSFHSKLVKRIRESGLEKRLAELNDPIENGIEPNANQLLACDWLGAFGGFFRRDQREHDYLIGRLSGLAWLSNQNLINDDDLDRQLAALMPRLEESFLPETERKGSCWILAPYLAVIVLLRLPWVLLRDWIRSPRPAN